jgi:hypothetical protein
MIERARQLWLSVTEPRHLKATYFVIYLLTAVLGVVSIAVPPRMFDGVAGPASSATLSWLLIVGGIGGAVSVFPGWWWAERLLGIAPILLGLAVLIVSLGILHAQHHADGESRLSQIGITLLAAAPFILRFQLIREFSYEPRR